MWKVVCHAITPSRSHTVHTKLGKSWKPQIGGKLSQILRDRKLWNRCIYISVEPNEIAVNRNITSRTCQVRSSTWQIWQRATTCRHLPMKFVTKISKAFLFYTINVVPWFCILGFRGILCRSAIPSFYDFGGFSASPSFRRSSVSPFHRSIIRAFRVAPEG